MSDADCFGNLWDMSSKECPQCADRDICAILFKDKVDHRAKKIEEDLGSKFLDEADFDRICTKLIMPKVTSGVTTAAELMEIAMELSNCSDVPSVKQKVVEWVRSEDGVKISGGVLWIN